MHRRNLQAGGPGTESGHPFRWLLFLVIIGALAFLLGVLRPRPHRHLAAGPAEAAARPSATARSAWVGSGRRESRSPRPTFVPALTAEEIVAGKLAQFARSRHELARALALKHNVEMPAEVEQFFAAVESGNWDAIEAAYKKINGAQSNGSRAGMRSPEVNQMWPAIVDAYGVAKQAHLWPAQQLLDYGNAVLGALRPGMVYLGGTDNGRWIPELLNDTSDGERHVIIAQNGLAAGDYLEYLRLQYDGQLANLSEEDSKRAFDEYVADAQKRLEHDQEFPNEPKQIRTGENIRVENGAVNVVGQVAVMAINEKLLLALMQKNPDLSFALQESFAIGSTYADALPLGPLMELRAAGDQSTFTAERAAEALDYWRNTAQAILADPHAADSTVALESFAHDSAATASLLAAHGFTTEAEAAYRLATQLWPASPESIYRLAELLTASGRQSEALQLVEEFTRKYP